MMGSDVGGGALRSRGMLLAALIGLAVCALSPLLPVRLHFLLLPLGLLCLIPALRRPLWLFGTAVAAVFLLSSGLYRLSVVVPARRLGASADTMTAEVIACPDSGHWYTVRVEQAGRLPVGTRLRLYCSDRTAPALHDRIAAAVTLSVPDGDPDRYGADGVFLCAYPTSSGDEAVQLLTAGEERPVERLRRELLTRLRERLPGEEGAVLAAMLLGETRALPESLQTAFRACGLPHLLVVSGLHLSLITGAVYAVLRACRLSRRLASVGTMAAAVLFMQLVGLTPSVLRAGIMCLIMLAGQLFRRQADGMNSLGTALVVLLLRNPYAIRDVGLQLSFAAAAGVLCLTPALTTFWRVDSRGRIGHLLLNNLAVTLGASLPLLPLLAWHFRTVSWISPLANLLAVLPSGWLLLAGMAGVFCLLCPLTRFLGSGLLLIAGWLAGLLNGIARLLGRRYAVLPLRDNWMILWVTVSCIGIGWALLRRHRRAARRMLCVTLALCAAVNGALFFARRYTGRIGVLTGREAVSLVIGCDGRYAVLVQDIAGLYEVRQMLGQLGDPPVETLILGGGSLPDTALATDFIAETAPQTVWLAGDTAWTAGSRLSAGVLSPGEALPILGGGSVRLSAEGWWTVELRQAKLTVAPPDAAALPPDAATDGAVVFAGDTGQQPFWTAFAASVWVCTDSRQTAHGLPGIPTASVLDRACWLVTRSSGEWSITDDNG